MDPWIDGGKGERGEENRKKTWGDVQVVTQYPRAENARGEEITTQIRIAPQNASDCLVAVFFLYTSTGQKSVMEAEGGVVKWPGLPFLATIFHTVGLNVMDPSERNRDVLDVSTRALRDMAATSWLRTEPPHFMHGRNFTYT